jgi:hypothetical protein
MVNRIVVGLDIGQRRDFSGIVVLEAREQTDAVRDPVTYDFQRRTVIELPHLERIRLGTPFAQIVDRVAQVVNDPRLKGCTLVADASGLGAPVVESLRAARLPCRLIPAQITGGGDESYDGDFYRVPKRDLVVGLQILFDRWPFEMAQGLPAMKALVEELINFKAARSSAGNLKYAGPRDDLTMSLALAWWWLKKVLAHNQPQKRLI